MLSRLACCVILVALAALPRPSQAADCAQEVSRLMSRDTEKLTSRYNRAAQRIERQGANAKLVAEECRVARQLRPRLEDQIAALKHSGCARDPSVGAMIADIVRGHEGDLAMMRKSMARPECK
jgi:hypothetical protein